MSKIKETKVYSINDFLEWFYNGELELAPKYQRNSVWNMKAKSYLIDTILRGMPIPQIFIRQTIDIKSKRTFREVIDGQQRLRAITEFVNNEFSILKSHNEDYAGYFYNDLDEDDKEQFLSYSLPVEIIKTKDDATIYNMFARLNTNTMTLNRQELRNAKYWGEFKVFCYKVSSEWREFFIDNRIFTDKHLARMNDVEYLSGIINLIMNGIQTDTPNSIDSL